MKSTELRIGNYVNEWWCADNKYYVKKLDINLFRCVIEDWTEWEPIPLTEEWLVKFGFEKDFDGSFMFGIISIFKDKRLKQNVYIYTESTSKYSDGQWVVILDLKLQYVHQLQNLYFALTGEELTIKNEDR